MSAKATKQKKTPTKVKQEKINQTCVRCDISLPVTDFSPKIDKVSKVVKHYNTSCKVCTNAYRFGMTKAECNTLLQNQNEQCAFCKLAFTKGRYYIDHNHFLEATLKAAHTTENDGQAPKGVQEKMIMKRTVRGLLCSTCNICLFNVHVCKMLEKVEELDKAKEYAKSTLFTEAAIDAAGLPEEDGEIDGGVEEGSEDEEGEDEDEGEDEEGEEDD